MLTAVLFYGLLGAFVGLQFGDTPLHIISGALLAQLSHFVVVPSGVLGSNKLKTLTEQRATKFERMEALHKLADDEKRELTEEEQTEWDTLETEMTDLDKNIKREQEFVRRQAEMAATQGTQLHADDGGQDAEKREASSFSFLKFVREASNGALTGLELEMHQEAETEARSHGVEIRNYGIPQVALTAAPKSASQKRAQTITQGTQPDDGGELVQIEYGSFMDVLRANLVLTSLGARFLTGLQGNLEFDEKVTASSFTWKGEVETLDETGITFGKKTMTPNRLGGYVDISKLAMIQTTPAIEQLVREDMAIGMSLALQLAAISGSGVGNIPEGILNATGTSAVTVGANGGGPTRALILEHFSSIDTQNALQGTLGWLFHPSLKYKLMNTKVDAGSGIFLMEEQNSLMGYNVQTTTQVPTNLTKGSGTNLTAAIFGNWSDFYIGQWGGIDLMVNPYTKAKQGMVEVIIDGFFDQLTRRPESFSVCDEYVFA